MNKKLITVLSLLLILLSLNPVNVYASSKTQTIGFTVNSDLKYYIRVNRKQNTVVVYKKTKQHYYSKIVHIYTCSTGKNTPKGTFKTSDQYRWRALYGNVYGQYATRITGHILFHSVPYTSQDKNTLEWEEYNKLGTSASLGCIRLRVCDAKWIYKHCKKGTVVEIYDGKLDVKKPVYKKLKENTKMDPTDQ